MTRPTRDDWGLELAEVTSKRATCLRRSVGCVLVNERGHILATGYNGVSAGAKHCNEVVNTPSTIEFTGPPVLEDGKYATPYKVVDFGGKKTPHACPGAQSASGTNLDGCQAIHAEQNALMQCHNVWEIHTCYVTTSSCTTCVKLLLNTSCQRIVFSEEYAHNEAARALWTNAGRYWKQEGGLG